LIKSNLFYNYHIGFLNRIALIFFTEIRKNVMIAHPQTDRARDDYLEAEKNSLIKHEYIQGKVDGMAGSSDAHVTISINIASALKNH